MENFNNFTNKQEIENNSEIFNEAVAALASEFHEDWRKTRLNEDGSFEPRLKSTSDEAWIAKHGMNEVDIANTSYDDLPEDWQYENKQAATVVVNVLSEYNGSIELENDMIRSVVGEKIHSAWLERNSWAAGGELDVPFDNLSFEEQEKDIDQIRVAKRVFDLE